MPPDMKLRGRLGRFVVAPFPIPSALIGDDRCISYASLTLTRITSHENINFFSENELAHYIPSTSITVMVLIKGIKVAPWKW
jgi:hypothetical protein